MNVAPFDVRQGSFVGAGVNTVTRSGTNRLTGSFYHRLRDQDWVGTDAAGETVNPGTFTFRNTGGWAAGPIIKNKWFAFGNYEDEKDTRPHHDLALESGRRAGGWHSDARARVGPHGAQQLPELEFQLRHGARSTTSDKLTPAKRFLLRSDYNVNNRNKVSFRYNHLNSSTDVGLSGSAFGWSRPQHRTAPDSSASRTRTTSILENIRSGIGEWNSVIGTSMANSFQSGYTYQDESRGYSSELFPFVDIFQGGSSYTSFGFEPFTVNNELRYKTFQAQDNFTKFTTQNTVHGRRLRREVSLGQCVLQLLSAERLRLQLAVGLLHRRQRVPGEPEPDDGRRSRCAASRCDGATCPARQADQPLDVWYSAAYVQDEWRPRDNLTVTGGIRFDVSLFKNTAIDNANADALTFRDETGNAVQYKHRARCRIPRSCGRRASASTGT